MAQLLKNLPAVQETRVQSLSQMSGQVSRGSAGKYQADDQAGVARLTWRVSGRLTGWEMQAGGMADSPSLSYIPNVLLSHHSLHTAGGEIHFVCVCVCPKSNFCISKIREVM